MKITYDGFIYFMLKYSFMFQGIDSEICQILKVDGVSEVQHSVLLEQSKNDAQLLVAGSR